MSGKKYNRAEGGNFIANNVTFKQGKKKQYDDLTEKDRNTLYWLEDTCELYKGEVLYATGAEATVLASGLMSAADKAKIDALSVGSVAGLAAVDSSISISSGASGTAIGVQISNAKNNALALKEDGLFVPANAAPDPTESSVHLDEANANGLIINENGLGLMTATAVNAGAMSAKDKAALDTVMESIVWRNFDD